MDKDRIGVFCCNRANKCLQWLHPQLNNQKNNLNNQIYFCVIINVNVHCTLPTHYQTAGNHNRATRRAVENRVLELDPSAGQKHVEVNGFMSAGCVIRQLLTKSIIPREANGCFFSVKTSIVLIIENSKYNFIIVLYYLIYL